MNGLCEIFECRNCFHAGPLSVHGRCQRCDSDAVISQEVIALLLRTRNVVGTTPDSLAVMPMGQA